ncbi:hypothetical protein J7E97_07835 [Streptomyces sp. ISL-66]|uniref:hypothetical protein n=1 Tax=Streptomyces sp. ISL-66 TaxID=2819186 RepID=UPI001BE93B01|nr:hypothetical protein [Streptomyces sp. ISL-66]MBT2467783.1 hypothetical protein [Streptomyces sp. ISL-66]
MTHMMPDRVADLIPSQRPKPAAPAAAPLSVALFSATRRPSAHIEAAVAMFDAERGLKLLRGPLLSVEDQGDRETLLGQYAAADKVLSATALRQSTAVLS